MPMVGGTPNPDTVTEGWAGNDHVRSVRLDTVPATACIAASNDLD